MPRTKALLLLVASLLLLAWPASCSSPLLFPVAKDRATSLYTIPVRDGHSHVIDLAGPLLWSTCAADHLPAAFKCQDRACKLANAYRPPAGCREAGRKPCTKQCTAFPSNPVTGQCAATSLIHTRLVANTTDGRNPVRQASVRAVGACAPRKLLARLPADVKGVAGLAGAGLALPAQVAASQHVASKFLLCLPRDGGEGVAIFGGGPFFLPATPTTDLTSTLAYTPLKTREGSPAYYLPVTAIAVGGARLRLRGDALTRGGVVFSTTAPYTTLRADVYRPLVDALDAASGWKDIKVPAVAPFELCYNSSHLPITRIGHLAPSVDLVLQDGQNYSIGSLDSMVDLDLGGGHGAACFALVEMKTRKRRGEALAAAVEIGGFQMEDNVLQFDLEKRKLGFAKLPFYTACRHFTKY